MEFQGIAPIERSSLLRYEVVELSDQTPN